MNQEKVGKFIAECRKEKGLTQAQIAEKFGISNKAVSKWENGKSLPDASIMLELCELLNITVNDLLSGERISTEKYKEKAEENLIELQKTKTKLQKLAFIIYWISVIITFIAITYVLINQGRVTPVLAIIPMLVGMISMSVYRNDVK